MKNPKLLLIFTFITCFFFLLSDCVPPPSTDCAETQDCKGEKICIDHVCVSISTEKKREVSALDASTTKEEKPSEQRFSQGDSNSSDIISAPDNPTKEENSSEQRFSQGDSNSPDIISAPDNPTKEDTPKLEERNHENQTSTDKPLYCGAFCGTGSDCVKKCGVGYRCNEIDMSCANISKPSNAPPCSKICGQSSNVSPTIKLLTPNGDTVTSSFKITWTDSDPDNNASISLYYDTNNSGTNGKLIMWGISEDSTKDSYTWTPLGLPNGKYYIYAVIQDGIDITQMGMISYSPGPITVNIPPATRSSSDVALASKGASVTGGTNRHVIIDGAAPEHYDSKAFGYTRPESEKFEITLNQMYNINKIDLLLFYPNGGGVYRYKVETSGDKRNWTTILHKTQKDYSGWQRDTFPHINVRYIRITGTKTNNYTFKVVEVKAYYQAP